MFYLSLFGYTTLQLSQTGNFGDNRRQNNDGTQDNVENQGDGRFRQNPLAYDDPESEIHPRTREAEARRRTAAQEGRGLADDYEHNKDFDEVSNLFARPYEHQHQRLSVRPEPTMKELSAPTFNKQPWCIESDPAEDEFEVKSVVVHH